MSEKTVKLETWRPQAKPSEDSDMLFHRKFLTEIVFGLHYRKKQLLAEMQMPPQPISLKEIYREYLSRVETLKSINQWKDPVHGKRWVDRRVNEIACAKYSENGMPKVVAVTAGLYTVNPVLLRT